MVALHVLFGFCALLESDGEGGGNPMVMGFQDEIDDDDFRPKPPAGGQDDQRQSTGTFRSLLLL